MKINDTIWKDLNKSVNSIVLPSDWGAEKCLNRAKQHIEKINLSYTKASICSNIEEAISFLILTYQLSEENELLSTNS